jgi:HlyD family secretion protein
MNKIILITLAVGSLFAQPTVSRDAVWVDSVKRGTMIRSVRGLGTIADGTTVELKIAETQMAEVKPGQAVDVDTRVAGLLKGRVTRVDTTAINGTVTVAVGLDQPTSVATGTSVDGAIQLDRLNDVMYVGRPVFAKLNSEATIFKIDADNAHATKVPVRFGRVSVNTVEVVEGIKVGDRVILSDMKAYDQYDRITLR